MTLIWRVLPILFLATTVFAQDGWWDKRDKRGNKGTRHGAAPDILKISWKPESKGVLVELGRIRGEKYQVGLMFFSLDDFIGGGFLGIGRRSTAPGDGSREWGYLLWPISIFDDDVEQDDEPEGAGSGQLYYRFNSRFASLEVGVFVSNLYRVGKNRPDVSIYLGVSI